MMCPATHKETSVSAQCGSYEIRNEKLMGTLGLSSRKTITIHTDEYSLIFKQRFDFSFNVVLNP